MKNYQNITIKKYISHLKKQKLLPNCKSIEEAIKTYNAFDNGMYEVDAKKYGVVCFKLKVIKHNFKFGNKNVEARLFNSKYLSYQIGDTLVFLKCSKIIIDIRKYKN